MSVMAMLQQPTNIQCGLLHQPTSVSFASPPIYGHLSLAFS